MTFFLSETAVPEVQARGTDRPLPSFWGGVSAAFRKAQIEDSANFRLTRETQAEKRRLTEQVLAQTDEPIRRWYEERGLENPDMETARRVFLQTAGADDFTAKFARESGQAFGFDLSEEGIAARVNERLVKEYRDATETLDAMGSGRTTAEILGAVAGMTADVRNLPFLFGGGGGSLARVMGREAMLNVAAEAAMIPSRQDVAERLNIPAPDIATTLALAAVGGAALGGAVEGLGRAVTYWRGTRGVPSERVAAHDVEMNTDIAEDMIARGEPLAQLPERVVEAPPVPKVDAPERMPDAPTAAPARSAEALDAPSVPEPRLADLLTPERAPSRSEPDLFDRAGGVGERQMDIEDLIAGSRAAEPRAEPDDPLPPSLERRLTAEAGGNRPLIQHLKTRYGGIAPSSRLGQELKAMGITPHDAPALFRTQGRQGFDNIPASEEPELAAILGDDGNGYLDEVALADAIADEIRGNPLPVTREQQAARIELNERRIERDRIEREARIAAGRELDAELNELPDVPGWMDETMREDYAAQDLRQDGERRVDMGDGRGERSVASVLDELDADDEFAAILDLCGGK